MIGGGVFPRLPPALVQGPHSVAPSYFQVCACLSAKQVPSNVLAQVSQEAWSRAGAMKAASCQATTSRSTAVTRGKGRLTGCTVRFKPGPKQAWQQASGRTRCRENKKWLWGVTLACLEMALGGEHEAVVDVSVCGLLG